METIAHDRPLSRLTKSPRSVAANNVAGSRPDAARSINPAGGGPIVGVPPAPDIPAVPELGGGFITSEISFESDDAEQPLSNTSSPSPLQQIPRFHTILL